MALAATRRWTRGTDRPEILSKGQLVQSSVDARRLGCGGHRLCWHNAFAAVRAGQSNAPVTNRPETRLSVARPPTSCSPRRAFGSPENPTLLGPHTPNTNFYLLGRRCRLIVTAYGGHAVRPLPPDRAVGPWRHGRGVACAR